MSSSTEVKNDQNKETPKETKKKDKKKKDVKDVDVTPPIKDQKEFNESQIKADYGFLKDPKSLKRNQALIKSGVKW